MPSIVVIDGNGNTQTVQSLPPVGQATGANSLPVVIASDQTLAVSVSNVGSAAVFNGQQTCTTSAANLPSQAITQGVRLVALGSNTGTVFVGGSSVTTSNGFPLYPGAFYDFHVNNANLVYIVGSDNTQVVAYVGS